MNKNICKFLSVSALLASMAIPTVEGVKTWSQKKTYSHMKKMVTNRTNRKNKNTFVDQLKATPEWNHVSRYFRINRRRIKDIPVRLFSRNINSQQRFDTCFNFLNAFIVHSNEPSKSHGLKLIDNLISVGDRKGFTQQNHRQTVDNLRNNSIARRLDFDAVAGPLNLNNNNNNNSIIDISDTEDDQYSSSALSSSHITTHMGMNE